LLWAPGPRSRQSIATPPHFLSPEDLSQEEQLRKMGKQGANTKNATAISDDCPTGFLGEISGKTGMAAGGFATSPTPNLNSTTRSPRGGKGT